MSDHPTHDPELIAAYAAGDATGSDLVAAEGLVAGCAECATLHRDLRAIMTALPNMPAPARTRDFRLTRAQAVAIRPSRLARLLAPLAGARFAFAAPAGAGLAALGLAGILLSGGLNVQPPSAANTPVDKAVAGGAEATDANEVGVMSVTARPASDVSPAPAPPLTGPSAAPTAAASMEVAQPAASTAASVAPFGAVNQSQAASPAASADAFALPVTPAPTRDDLASTATPSPAPAEPTGPSPAAVLSAVLLAVGGALLVLRVGARRVARDSRRG